MKGPTECRSRKKGTPKKTALAPRAAQASEKFSEALGYEPASTTQRSPSFSPRRFKTDPLASRAGGGGVNELTSAGGIGKSCGFVSYIFRQAAQCAAARYVGIWLFMVCTWPSRDPAVPFNMPASAIIW